MNRDVQPQKMARGLKFRITVVEGSYYPYSENKGADQLRGYREADLRLCFRICKNPVFSRRGSYANAKQTVLLTSLTGISGETRGTCTRNAIDAINTGSAILT